MVLIFSDLNKTQIFKMPHKDGSRNEIETLMIFDYLNSLEPNEQKEDYYIRKPNDEILLFQVKENEFVYVGEKVISFRTDNKVVNYSSNLGFNDIKYIFAYSEKNIYNMLHQKVIPIQEYENSTQKDEYKHLYIKDCELKGNGKEGILENGNDFVN